MTTAPTASMVRVIGRWVRGVSCCGTAGGIEESRAMARRYVRCDPDPWIAAVRSGLGRTVGMAGWPVARSADPRSAGSPRSSVLAVEEYAGVQDPGRVEGRLGGPQRGGEHVGSLRVVPGSVVATDGVVMGDGAPGRQQCLRGSSLDLGPLGQFRSRGARGQ